MISTKVGSTSTNGSTGTQSTQRARIGKSNAVTQTGKVDGVSKHVSNPAYLHRFTERPKLITELSDMHKAHCSATISMELLRRIVSSLVSIKKILQQGEFSPELLNQIDIEKKLIMEAVETRVFGQYVLDSSFNPVTGLENWIEFTVAGLDLKRERLTNELVTLYINGRMLPLAFDRTVSDRELIRQFEQQAGYSNMTLRVAEKKALVLGVRDSQWRVWDGTVFVSGQAGRFAAGQPMSFQVKAIEPTVEDVTRLDLRETTSVTALDPVLTHVNRIYRDLHTTIGGHNEGIEQLFELCHDCDDALMEKTKTLMEQKPGRAAMAIYRNYSGPSRENVINLLEG